MAGKTIDLYRRIGMTGLTELALGINRDKLASGILVGMAVNAPGETVFDGANTLMHRLVTVMFHEIKMITTHNLNRLNALLPASRGNLGLCNIAEHYSWNTQGGGAH